MDLDDKLFGELFGFQGKKSTATPVISPSRPPGATTIQEDSSNLDEDSDDDFALPPTPAATQSPPPAKKTIVVEGERAKPTNTLCANMMRTPLFIF